jgi:hypothetical protein
MRFISIFTHEPVSGPPSEEMIAKMGKLIEEGMKAGWLVTTEGVEFGAAGVRVHRSGGRVTVTDGPFSEAKEVIGGYALLEASSKEAAVELCRKFLNVAGDGTCEVYQLYQQPHSTAARR